MSISLLITGANKKTREKEAFKKAGENSSTFDVVVIDAAENHGIGVVREISSHISRLPFNSNLSSVIILEAGQLTIEAQNALLKMLEEPPEKAQLILTSSSKENLLPTVKSRLSEIDLGWERGEVRVGREEGLATFAEKLDYFDKAKLDEVISSGERKLSDLIQTAQNPLKIKQQQKYLKLLLKMHKATSLNINKKLISLILALETPS